MNTDTAIAITTIGLLGALVLLLLRIAVKDVFIKTEKEVKNKRTMAKGGIIAREDMPTVLEKKDFENFQRNLELRWEDDIPSPEKKRKPRKKRIKKVTPEIISKVKRLKKAKIDGKKISQKEIAEMVGIGQSTVSSILKSSTPPS